MKGSIPALTGKPPPQPSPGTTNRVYPRAYGETQPPRCAQSRSRGLSPRLRGNPPRANHRTRLGGSIPALTGKPRAFDLEARVAEVYPRAYGETATTYSGAQTNKGLSPRLRGNQRVERDR